MTSQRESKKHEIACGSEIEMPRGIETGTDAEVINREDFACNTIVKTNEMAIGT